LAASSLGVYEPEHYKEQLHINLLQNWPFVNKKKPAARLGLTAGVFLGSAI